MTIRIIIPPTVVPSSHSSSFRVFGPVALNCAAPDDGNMSLLNRVLASDAMKDEWLQPIIDGRVRSSFAMTCRTASQQRFLAPEAAALAERYEREAGERESFNQAKNVFSRNFLHTTFCTEVGK